MGVPQRPVLGACWKFRLLSDRTLSLEGVHVRKNRTRPRRSISGSSDSASAWVHAYPFAIDSHQRLVVDAQILDLRDVPNALHVGSITASTEDDRDTRARIDIRRRDEGSSRVVDKCCQLCGNVLGQPRVKHVDGHVWKKRNRHISPSSCGTSQRHLGLRYWTRRSPLSSE